MRSCQFLVGDVRHEAEVLAVWGEKHRLHFHAAQERSSLLFPSCLEREEAVLDPRLGGKGEEREGNLALLGELVTRERSHGNVPAPAPSERGGKMGYGQRLTAGGELAVIFSETLHLW